MVACRHIIVGSLLGGSCVPAWKRPSQKHPSWKDAAARQLSLPIGSYSITLALAPRSSLPTPAPRPCFSIGVGYARLLLVSAELAPQAHSAHNHHRLRGAGHPEGAAWNHRAWKLNPG